MLVCAWELRRRMKQCNCEMEVSPELSELALRSPDNAGTHRSCSRASHLTNVFVFSWLLRILFVFLGQRLHWDVVDPSGVAGWLATQLSAQLWHNHCYERPFHARLSVSSALGYSLMPSIHPGHSCHTSRVTDLHCYSPQHTCEARLRFTDYFLPSSLSVLTTSFCPRFPFQLRLTYTITNIILLSGGQHSD